MKQKKRKSYSFFFQFPQQFSITTFISFSLSLSLLILGVSVCILGNTSRHQVRSFFVFFFLSFLFFYFVSIQQKPRRSLRCVCVDRRSLYLCSAAPVIDFFFKLFKTRQGISALDAHPRFQVSLPHKLGQQVAPQT